MGLKCCTNIHASLSIDHLPKKFMSLFAPHTFQRHTLRFDQRNISPILNRLLARSIFIFVKCKLNLPHPGLPFRFVFYHKKMHFTASSDVSSYGT